MNTLEKTFEPKFLFFTEDPFRIKKAHLVHNQNIRPRDPWSPFSRHLIPARDVNHVDDEIRQLPRVVRRQVVPAALDEQEVRGIGRVQGLQGVQVGADVLADRGVRAPARLDGGDAVRRQGGVRGEELGVFAAKREDVSVHALSEGVRYNSQSGDGDFGVFLGRGEEKVGPHRVKMSLVTAAMLYSSRSARQSLSIRAVLPDPTGLVRGEGRVSNDLNGGGGGPRGAFTHRCPP